MNNIGPRLWGEAGWEFLHYITFSYPDNPNDIDRQNMRNFMNSLGPILPCEKCRYNFKSHTTRYPLTDTVLQSRAALVNWMVVIHNEVNRTTGKPPTSVAEITAKYFDKSYGLIENKIFVTGVLFAIIMIIIAYIRYNASI